MEFDSVLLFYVSDINDDLLLRNFPWDQKRSVMRMALACAAYHNTEF